MSKPLSFKQKQNQENLNKLNNLTVKKKNKIEKQINFVVYSYSNQCKPQGRRAQTSGRQHACDYQWRCRR